jgi:hypothetical protein
MNDRRVGTLHHRDAGVRRAEVNAYYFRHLDFPFRSKTYDERRAHEALYREKFAPRNGR